MNESTDTLALTEFLLARIADDEAVAREATRGPWESEVGGSEGYYLFGPRGLNARLPQRRDRIASVTWGSFDSCKADGTHIALHDPARVLAECEAKRRIVELHRHDVEVGNGFAYVWCHECGPDDGPSPQHGEPDRLYCATTRILAAIYADHPHFREEWKP